MSDSGTAGPSQSDIPSAAPGIPSTSKATVAAGLAAGALLSQEILFGRLLSVVTWYSFGYFVLSAAMLGMTAGALFVYLRPKAFDAERMARTCAALLIAAGLLTVEASVLLSNARISLWVPRPAELALELIEVTLTIALPFAAIGAALAALLSHTLRPGIVYGGDLVGAAAGALLAAPVLSLIGAPRAIAGSALLPILAAILLAPSNRLRIASVAAAAFALTVQLSPDALRVHYFKTMPIQGVALGEGWNSLSYVRAPEFELRPGSYWGPLADAPQLDVWQSFIRIDGEASTPAYAYHVLKDDLSFILKDVTATAYWLRKSGAGLVIGLGGGRDAAAALVNGQTPVDAVEVNPLVAGMLKGPLASRDPLLSEPNLRLHIEDGRSWLARSGGQYETLVVSLVDTWAATGAGAMTFTESALYTREAWRLYFDHLNPDGIVSFSRWYDPANPVEVGRLVSLAAAALRDRGIQHPEKHMAVVSSGLVANLVASPSPLSDADLALLSQLGASGSLRLLLPTNDHSSGDWLARLASAPDDEALEALSAEAAVDLNAPTDNRPFFFLQVPFSTWLNPSRVRAFYGHGGGLFYGNVIATAAVTGAFLVAIIVSFFVLILPFVRRRSSGSTLPLPDRAMATLYFISLGLGFMLFEVATAQRLSIILGNPTWALALTLAPLTLCSGLAAFASDRLDLADRRVALWVPAIAVALLAIEAALPLSFASTMLSHGRPFRAVFSIVSAGMPGLALGALFPLGLRKVNAAAPQFSAWCWGVNGTFSVMGSAAAAMISVAWGFRASLFAAMLSYVVAWVLAQRVLRMPGPEAPKPG